ncbi:hypothetical protein [Hymenobacter jeollabukensis]|uniref:DUF3857 domain-containing protein n=1 Tax=Hymenobacter jeollabukensis TaxID=2025313 RepID=A0A5R8WVT5_9BACT|nr:hypothetical protein [Hymenobacter jeollabukensis]TLM96589.1 hypothetical protein FDY95_00925 [Hymenobacter jeollabukensis]
MKQLLLSGLLTFGLVPAWAQQEVGRHFASSTVLLTNGDTLRGELTLYTEQNLLIVKTADGTQSTQTPFTVKAFAAKGQLTQQLYTTLLFDNTRIENLGSGNVRAQDQAVTVFDTTMHAFVSYRNVMRTRLTAEAEPGFYEVLSIGNICLWQRTTLWARPLGYQPQRKSGSANNSFVPVSFNTDARNLLAHKVIPAPTQSQSAARNRPYDVHSVTRLYYVTSADSVLLVRQPKTELLSYFQESAPRIKTYARYHKLSYTKPDELAVIVDYANGLQRATR